MSGRGSAAATLAVALVVLSPASPALGDPEFQGVGEASVGYTDNIQSAPDEPVAGVAPKEKGVFLVLRPGVVLAAASARAIHRLAYTYTYDLFLQTTSASTSSNQFEYRGFFDLSPRATLVVGASAVQSNQYSAIMLTPPGAGAVNATPAGSGAFLSASADELASIDLAPDLRGYEGLNVTEQTPLFNTVAPRTFLAVGHVGFERAFRADAVGADARAEYSVVDGSLGPDGTALGVQRQVVGTGVGIWRHDWSRYVTSRAEAGALRVERLDAGRGFWEPAGSASLGYVALFGDAELAYAHRATTNPLLGQSFLIDEVRLRGSLPLTESGDVTLSASSGYQWGRLLDENVALASRVDAILADVGIGWQATELFLFGLRYQHGQQISDTRVPPLPLSFVRNSVMLGVAFRLPAERTMPRAYRAPQRVDRADEVRDTGKPAQGGSQPPSGGGGGT